MSESTERRSRPAWRPLAVAVAGGALLVTTGFGVWASLNATAFNTTPQELDRLFDAVGETLNLID